MFKGWASLGGVEIINAARTYAYAQELAPAFTLNDCHECDDLHLALGDKEYRSPILDEPTWFDPENPDTYNFAGFYPLSVSGVENSNREVSVLQSIRDGGVIGPTRLATKDVLVRGILIAGDPCSLQAGIEWFKYVLNGNVCSDGCEGDSFCFFYCCPDVVEGVVDENSLAKPHELSLQYKDWTTTSGEFIDGVWNPTVAPATATGPEFEGPCDDMVLEAKLSSTEDQSVIFEATNSDGTTAASTGEVVIHRTNYARNPTFRENTLSWFDGDNTTITKELGFNSGIITMDNAIVSDETIATFDGGYPVAAGDIYSGRVTAELLPPESSISTNLIENPRAQTSEYFWFLESGISFSSSLDSTHVINFPTSYQTTVEIEQSAGSTGWVGIGGHVDDFLINVKGNTDYFVQVQVYPTVSTEFRPHIRFIDASDNVTIIDPNVDAVLTVDTWNTIQFQVTSSPGAVRAWISIGQNMQDTTVLVGTQTWYDAALMVESSTPVSYFDGDSVNAEWNGIPNESTSTLIIPTPDICLTLQLGVFSGGIVTPILGQNYILSQFSPIDLEITDITIPFDGTLIGIINSCDSIDSEVRVRLSEAIITKTSSQIEYFDGDSSIEGFDTSWTGMSNNSSSVREIENNTLILNIPEGDTVPPLRPELTVSNASELTVEELILWHRDSIEPSECVDKTFSRTLRNVVTTSGPEILRKVEECDHAIAEVEFTLTAANPYIWHLLPLVVELTEDEEEEGPEPPGILEPQQAQVFHFPPRTIDAEDDCPDDSAPLPISDPLCPLPPAPPRPPLPADCLEDVDTYVRRAVGITGDLFSQWQEAVPIINLENRSSKAVRQARIRFFTNPLERTSLDDIDPCGFCGEFIISYMPKNSIIIIDGMIERARIDQGGSSSREATHLLYGADGGPMTWPSLTCGVPYIMTVDVSPVDVDLVTAKLSVAVRS